MRTRLRSLRSDDRPDLAVDFDRAGLLESQLGLEHFALLQRRVRAWLDGQDGSVK